MNLTTSLSLQTSKEIVRKFSELVLMRPEALTESNMTLSFYMKVVLLCLSSIIQLTTKCDQI